MLSGPLSPRMRKMVRNIKAEAKAFLTHFHLSKVTLKSLKEVLRKQGYTVVEFNNIANNEHVSLLLEALGLQSLAKRSRGFTYADSQRRLVFLHEGLSDDEKLMVLAHEEGHIYCNHLSSVPVLGCDVAQEHEANEFAHYLLHRSLWQKMGDWAAGRKKAAIAAVLAAAMLAAGFAAGYRLYCDHTYYGAYYITATGNKYHHKDCGYVKGKRNISRLTIEQYETGKYGPCGKCVPNHALDNTK